jgi:hypothetical protein
VGLIDQLSRVNMTRDSMDDDEDWVIPTNFVVVGSILIEFIHALSEHMVRLFVLEICRFIFLNNMLLITNRDGSLAFVI